MKDLLKYYIALQPKFREVMGDTWSYMDRFYHPLYLLMSYHPDLHGDLPYDKGVIRVPLTIDDSSEEARKRSLWGMVDWNKYGAFVQINGMIQITGVGFATIGWPTEAILRALVAQWGVEAG